MTDIAQQAETIARMIGENSAAAGIVADAAKDRDSISGQMQAASAASARIS